jgi:hypothetical protein
MDIKGLNKKELKEYINQNGFFFHLNCEALKPKKVNDLLSDTKLDMIKTGVELPQDDNIIVYKGIASQHYEAGEKSRNGYKYNQRGWIFDDYNQNPVILFQHDTLQPIWQALSFWIDRNKNLNIMFFVYKDALEWVDKIRVEKGLIKALSTGALTEEYKFENSEWELISEDEAIEEYWFSAIIDAFNWISDILTLVVTKARMLENSLVTIGSNEQAMAMQNWIGQYFKNKANLLNNNETMKTKQNEVEEEVIEEIKEEIIEETKEEVEEETNAVEIISLEELQEEEEAKEEAKEEEIIIEENSLKDIIEEVEQSEEITEVEEVEEEAHIMEDKIDNQTIITNDLDWNKSIDIKSDFEIKEMIKTSINNELGLILKDYISVEKYTKDIEDLKNSFDINLNKFNEDLQLKVNSLQEDSEAIVDTINDLVSKLRTTVFNSAWSYQTEKTKTSLAKKLEKAKQF